MGVEPFQRALEEGADLVLAGRATDTAIFAAIPLARGFDPGLTWHAGKIAECGTGSAEPRRRLDVLHVQLEKESFVVQPLADDLRCTPFSVAAHQLHEVADPFTLVEPGWTTDMRNVRYEAASDRSVRVSGSVAVPTTYTVKLEGVESAGFQRMFMLSVRDPTIVADIDTWVSGIQADIAIRCKEILGEGALERCQIHTRVYGRDGTMGPREPIKHFEGHEAFLLVDVVAPDQETCESASERHLVRPPARQEPGMAGRHHGGVALHPGHPRHRRGLPVQRAPCHGGGRSAGDVPAGIGEGGMSADAPTRTLHDALVVGPQQERGPLHGDLRPLLQGPGDVLRRRRRRRSSPKRWWARSTVSSPTGCASSSSSPPWPSRSACPASCPVGLPATPTWPAANSSSPSSTSRCARAGRWRSAGWLRRRQGPRTSLASDSTTVPSKKDGLAPPWSRTGLVKVNSLNCSGEMSPCSRSS